MISPRELLIFLISALAIAVAGGSTHAREWVSISGDTLEGTYVSIERENGTANVILERPDGKRFSVKYAKLSLADREYLKSRETKRPRFKSLQAEETEPTPEPDVKLEVERMMRVLSEKEGNESLNSIAASTAALLCLPFSAIGSAFMLLILSRVCLGFRPQFGAMYRANLSAGFFSLLSQIGGLIAVKTIGWSSTLAELAVALVAAYIFAMVLGHCLKDKDGHAIGFKKSFLLLFTGCIAIAAVTGILAGISFLLIFRI